MTIFGQLVQQIMPHFVTQRALYEVRERPSKTYSWKAFMISNIVVELPWNSLMAVLIFFCWYYPIGLYRNAAETDSVHLRGFQLFLFVWMFLLFTSTFTHMVIAGLDSAETGGNIANLMFSLCLIFCGVLAQPSQFPRFWIFMYRLSPFTYMVSGMLSVGLARATVRCAENEFVLFEPPNGSTCGQYIQDYRNMVQTGYMEDPQARDNCRWCSIDSTDAFLAQVSSDYSVAWRNFGILWAYVIFNIFAALALYWLIRMPKKTKKEKEDKKQASAAEKETAADQQVLGTPSNDGSRASVRGEKDSETYASQPPQYASITGTTTPPRQDGDISRQV